MALLPDPIRRPMTSSQQASWETNTYVLNTTRILVVFGTTYLVKSSFQLYRRMRTSNGSAVVPNGSIGAEERDTGFELGLNGLFLEDVAAFGPDDIADIVEMVEVRRPLPAYYPDAGRLRSDVSYIGA